MAYADRDDMVTRYGLPEIEGLEADENKGAGAVTAALQDAAAEIDGYLCQQYRLPLPAGKTFPLLKWASCDIARYRLWENKINDEVDTVYVRYKRIVRILEDLAAGKIALLDAEGLEVETADSTDSVCVIVRRPKVFTNDLLDNMDYGDFLK